MSEYGDYLDRQIALNEAMQRICRKKRRTPLSVQIEALDRFAASPHGRPPDPPNRRIALALRLSDAECACIDELRRRSYELAVQRGHVRRWRA